MIPHVTLVHFATRDVGPLVSYAKKLEYTNVPPIEISEITLVKSHSYRLMEDDDCLKIAVLEKVVSFTLR